MSEVYFQIAVLLYTSLAFDYASLCVAVSNKIYYYYFTSGVKVARYSFSGSIPPTFERKLRRHKQRFGKIDTSVVLDKDENLL